MIGKIKFSNFIEFSTSKSIKSSSLVYMLYKYIYINICIYKYIFSLNIFVDSMKNDVNFLLFKLNVVLNLIIC